jgi:hypothetical protein
MKISSAPKKARTPTAAAIKRSEEGVVISFPFRVINEGAGCTARDGFQSSRRTAKSIRSAML